MKILSGSRRSDLVDALLALAARAMLLLSTLTLVMPIAAQESAVEEVVVNAEYIPDEKLATADIAEILDASDMSITGDSNVGDALKRLPGLSLVGGKYVYIRGLGDRYSSTYFNGTPMPGLDPLSRAVPLDLFDSNVISNTLVQKTYSAEYSSEFTGGAIDIRSAAVPNENGFQFTLKTGYDSNSTGKKQLSYAGGGRDWLGFDDGSRDMPGIIRDNLADYPNFLIQSNTHSLSNEQIDSLRYSFSNKSNVWDLDNTGSNPLDAGFSTALKQRWELADNISTGLLATLSYDHKWRNRLEHRARFATGALVPMLDFEFGFDTPALDDRAAALSDEQLVDLVFDSGAFRQGGDFYIDADNNGEADDSPENTLQYLNLSSAAIYQRSVREVALNSLLALGVDIDNTHELKVTKMLLRQTTDESSVTLRRRGSDSDEFRRFTRLQWVENQVDFLQFSGLHILDVGEFSWRYSNVESNRDTPDTRVHGRAGINGNELQTQFPDALNPERGYDFLDDSGEEYGFDAKLPFTSDRRFISDFVMRFGYSDYTRRQSYEAYLYRYLLDNITDQLPGGASDPLLTGDLAALLDASDCVPGGDSDPSDACYLAENAAAGGADGIGFGAGIGNAEFGFMSRTVNQAYYIAFDFNVLESLRVNLGARKERFKIDGSLSGELPPGSNASEADLNPTVSSSGLYPSLKMTWKFYPNMQLRAAYSQTQNRPIARELILADIFNPDDGNIYTGNPDIKISDITSYDLRYEWYFGEQDYLSLTTFKKQIQNPIEVIETEVADGIIRFSWENEPFAVNEGVEFEIRKYFGEYFSLTGNAARVSSRLKIAGEFVNATDSVRPLQGVSEYLYNLQAVYKTGSSSVSLAWNYFSERISVLVGDNVNKFTVLEQPRHQLDFNAKHEFSLGDQDYSIGVKAKNLLAEDFRENYYTGALYDGYKRGRSYSLSLGIKL